MTETVPSELMRVFLENSLKRRLSSPMEAAEPLDSRGSALLEHTILEDLLKDYELYQDGRGHPLMAKSFRELSKVFEEFYRRAKSFKAEAVKGGAAGRYL